MSNARSIPDVSSPISLEELEFGGGPNEDVSKFLGAVKRAALKQGRQLDQQWITDYIESCLRGDALEWYIESDEVAAMDWRSLQKAFMGRFRAAHPATPTAPPTATTDAKAKATKRAKSEVEDAAETEPGASVTAGKKATATVPKKGAAAMDAAMATEAAATAEAAKRAATAAAKRAAAAAATATKAAEAAAEAMAEAKAAIAKMTEVGTAAARKQEVPKAPLPDTVVAKFGDISVKWSDRILIIGNSGVGKSSFLWRRLGLGWAPSITPTVGIELQVHAVLAGKTLNKDFYWDPSGAEEFRNLLSSYCRGLTRIWIVYDVTDLKSFQDVRRWYDLVKQYDKPMRLIGNKCDLYDRRVVPTQYGRDLATELGMKDFYELSARTNEGVQETWDNHLEVVGLCT
ncbi:GTP-binding protein [Tulasnella sp. JGI-2019a]|nr:GTP-binding protein [Tulasnella sp. JGI-2019a]